MFDENIHRTVDLYNKLGSVISYKMSQILPTQRIRILSFLIDRVKMIAAFNQEKKPKLKNTGSIEKHIALPSIDL